MVAEILNADRFKGRHRVTAGVEPGRFLQFGVGVLATGIDAVEVDSQFGVGGLGVGSIEIEVPRELAERAIHPRAHLAVGEADGAGRRIDVGVLDGMDRG
ncbi:hypothetical protein D3C85_855600 [compost metagenome]